MKPAAIHCQTETDWQIRDKGGDSILLVKGNQPTLRDEIKILCDQAGDRDDDVSGLRRHTTTDNSHGLHGKRQYVVKPPPASLRAVLPWADLLTVGIVAHPTDAEAFGFFYRLLRKNRLCAR